MLFLFGLFSSAFAAEDDFEFSLEGYYRARGYTFFDLYANQEGPGSFVAQRLRLQPQLDYKDESGKSKAKFIMMADVLDDVVWGDRFFFLPKMHAKSNFYGTFTENTDFAKISVF